MLFKDELVSLLKARQPGIWINTTEEKEAVIAIRNAIAEVGEYDDIYLWSMNEGIYQLVEGEESLDYEQISANPGFAELSKYLKESNDVTLNLSRVWVLKDYHLTFNNPVSIRVIRDLKEAPLSKYTPIIIISPETDIPFELSHLFTILNYDTPSVEDIQELIKAWCAAKGQEELSEEDIKIVGKRLYGFHRCEIIKMLNLSLVKYGTINLDIINEKKIESISESGVLDYKVPKANLDNVGGNEKFKEWVEIIESCMTEEAREYGIPTPKGYLSVGIPGSSKTYSAEALAGKWNVPFIKLNMSKINSRYSGETERNMAKALNLVKSCAPCVFLIDEIEKALGGYASSNNSDSGAIARAFGLVLEFLNDNDNGVFVVMTSNDVSQLPPELTRAGRLDATWYFSLPTLSERKEIFKIHLNRIGKEVDEETINKIAEETVAYTGAEIESIVKAALRRAFMLKVKKGIDNGIDYDILLESKNEVVPVALSSREKIIALENWSYGRALRASDSSEDEERIEDEKKSSTPVFKFKKKK